MKHGILGSLALALFLTSTSYGAEPGFVSLFNGHDLSGWNVDTEGIWQVQDGMIVGKSPGLSYNDFLRSEKVYRNFVLKLSFRLVAGEGNSGVQFRTMTLPRSHEVYGYQADIGDIGDTVYWGCLYDEARRRKVLVQPTRESLATLDKDGWNEYVITAEGDHITLQLNGSRTVDYYERDSYIDQEGIIALQVHAGAPMEIHFKDIQIRDLGARPGSPGSR